MNLPDVGPRLIAVGGGRGGLGKSLVSAQLARAFAAGGRRTVLVDLDLAAASQHLLFGLRGVAPGLALFLSPDPCASEAVVETSHPNLRLVTGGRGSLRPEALTAGARLRLLERLARLDADVVVLDVGAGIGYDPVDLLELGHQRLLVATGQAASVHAAFALLKATVVRTLRRQLGPAGQLGLLDPAFRTREGERLTEVVRRVRATDPALAATVAESLQHFGAFLFGNQLADATHLGALQALARMSAEYLGTSSPLLGWLRAQARLPELARRSAAGHDETDLFGQLADALMAGPAASSAALVAELAAAAAPPPVPVPRVQAPPRPPAPSWSPPPPIATAAPGAAPIPAPPIVRVYVRPPRRRRSELDRKPTPFGVDLRRRRPVALPGMPPGRARK